MGLAPEQLLANSLLSNVIPEFPGPGDLGRVGRRIDPKSALESPRTGALPQIRPASRRLLDTGRMAAVGHGGAVVIAWLSDSRAAGRGQAGSEVYGYATVFSTICLWPEFAAFHPVGQVRLYQDTPGGKRWPACGCRLTDNHPQRLDHTGLHYGFIYSCHRSANYDAYDRGPLESSYGAMDPAYSYSAAWRPDPTTPCSTRCWPTAGYMAWIPKCI